MKRAASRSLLAGSAVFALMTSATAFAQGAHAEQLEERFTAADKDGDGKLTLEEAKAGMPRVAKGFSRIDKDKNGHITLDELKVAMSSRGE
ncbi:MAG: EF-hand domain-containing protein [Methylibium sp.]|uniref:EF-hand domain-containing protein n=1 Tax=Methylibium sp. TaxID=2067992 RepID=UPI00181D51D1|nr:EF-hand domain-containing protein [Methylibium sp.]MBA2723512.1 EF-hand domain-containing protein [Methylibium sp.]MBA3589561.1 EF-hand domain-containing protein [Methylibium sp.]